MQMILSHATLTILANICADLYTNTGCSECNISFLLIFANFPNLLPVGISESSRRGYDGVTRIYRLVLELDEALTMLKLATATSKICVKCSGCKALQRPSYKQRRRSICRC